MSTVSRSTRRTLVAVVVAAALLPSCAPASGERASGAAEPSEIATTGTTGTTAPTAAGSAVPGTDAAASDEPREDPLGPYEEALFGEQDHEVLLAQTMQIEELVASCMKAEGFTYVPVDYASFSREEAAPAGADDGSTPGYGIALPPTETGNTGDTEDTGDSSSGPNLNDAYREALSASEQAAFDALLNGDPNNGSVVGADGLYDYDWRKGGCFGAASHEVQSASALEDPRFSALVTAVGELLVEAARHPDVVAAEEAWASCMSAAGHRDLQARNEAWERALAAWQEALAGVQDGEMIADDVLQEVYGREVELADADRRCAEDVGFDRTSRDVEVELERQFVERNRAELEALLAAYGQGE